MTTIRLHNRSRHARKESDSVDYREAVRQYKKTVEKVGLHLWKNYWTKQRSVFEFSRPFRARQDGPSNKPGMISLD